MIAELLSDPGDGWSFILVKPDSLSREDVKAAIKTFLSKHALRITVEELKRLRAMDVEAIYPSVMSDRTPYVREMLKCYLAGHQCQILVVEGTNAVQRCRELKGDIRESYAKSLFANCIHSPIDTHERDTQARQLWDVESHVTSSGGTEPPALPAVWGRLAAAPLTQIEIEVRSLWALQTQVGWDKLWQSPEALDGHCSLILVRNERLLIDFSASCVAQVFAQWSRMQALAATLETHRSGLVVLQTGPAASLQHKADLLRHYGLDAVVDGSERVGVRVRSTQPYERVTQE